MLLLTRSDAWESAADSRLDLGAAGAVWAPAESEDPAGLLAVADDAFPDGQVLAVELDPAPRPGLARGTVDPRQATRVRYGRRGPDGRHAAFLDRPATAAALGLLPHPEGGWFRETWRAPASFVPAGYPGERAAATGIYFLLPPGEESVWHSVRSDELWLWHRGGPLTLELGGGGERPGQPAAVALGPDLAAGQVPQALVPAGTWQAARPAAQDEVLVSCVVSPGFDFADFSV